MQPVRVILALALVGWGCAGTADPGTASPAARLGDPLLHEILATFPLDSAASAALQEYERMHPSAHLENIALVAEDPGASRAARFNALAMLGERQAAAMVPSLQIAATDRDPLVRAAAVSAAGQLLGERGSTGRSVVVAALDDPAPEVQVKALELLGTRDLPLLRAFLERRPRGAVPDIARGLLQSAEERGAPLAADSAGVLRRQTSGGAVVEFRPTRRWPEWDAAVGTVTVTVGTSPAVHIADVEVVAGVVPVFFSPEETAIVYEQGRRIHVRDLRSGQAREVGPGIAPRPLPFTSAFIYFREAPVSEDQQADRTRLKYDVVRTDFAAAAGGQAVLGQLGATAEMRLHGNYSPARWVQVIERQAQFTVEGEGVDRFPLPSPFTGVSRP